MEVLKHIKKRGCMKYRKTHIKVVILLMLTTVNLSHVNCIYAPSSFGKTHFIIGMPSEHIKQKTLVQPKNNVHCCAYFSPDDDLQKLLCDYIDNEQEAIDIAIFSFTNKKIAEALVRAYKRGVRIRIVTDPSGIHDRFSKILFLQESGIPIYVYNAGYKKKTPATLSDIMHNKFVIFAKNNTQRSFIWTGSFNFTKSATMSNQENILVSEQHSLVKQYNAQFSRLLSRSKRLKNQSACHKM